MTKGSIRLVCPSCESPDGLWAVASFPGWHSVDATLDGTRRSLSPVRRGDPYYEITSRTAADFDAHEMGCSCGWEGSARDLVQLGIDGNPLPEPVPGQEALEL